MITAAPVVITRLTALSALAYALCWLLPNHHVPWVDFYSDAWAALVLWVVGAVVFWRSGRDAPLAWHALPLMALAWLGIVWVQYGAGLIQMLGVAWTSGLYLGGVTLALLLGAAWERWRPGQCADFLFMAVLAGATGSLLIQLQQWLALNPGAAFWLFAPAPRTRFYANLGQPNQLASLLCLGVLACAWLHQRGRLPGWLALVWALPLALGIALTESRTSWVVVFLSVAALIAWRRRLTDARPIMAGALGWTGVFAMCVVALPRINVWLGHRDELRSLGDISTGSLRLEYWAKLGEALLHRPWSGYGWTQTSFAQFTVDPYGIVTGGTMRHAHNLVVDIGVGMGIPLGLAVSLALALWVLRAGRSIRRMEQLLMLLFVTALGVHAMLEFPLHYAYFLLPIGMMMGALNVALDFRPVLRSSRWVAGAAMALVALGLGITARDYIRIEEDFFALRFEHQRLAPQGAYAAPDTLALT
ncbi:MAG TPA: Wzy polymerase domain-containing protein, partial [Alicycliphilus sp.]|nr:Wzy polymerase domain-containing protein [Alicycliphilus sp.]